jgi:hypothetical protein
MGVICDLRLIDHERVVMDGRRAVDRALSAKDPNILREYIASLPLEINPAAIAMREERLARLREFQAPPMIIENEERHLAEAKGLAYRPEALALLSIDQLRETLGRWNWANWSYSLDKAWSELEWFLQPAEGQGDLLLYPPRPRVGEASQTLLDKALHGGQPSPRDGSGAPLIRTCGSPDEDCFGYNDPPTAAAIDGVLQAIDPGQWNEPLARRAALHRQAASDLLEDEVAEIADQELEFARDAFRILRQVYRDAADRGFGVACEYSL